MEDVSENTSDHGDSPNNSHSDSPADQKHNYQSSPYQGRGRGYGGWSPRYNFMK